MRKLRVDLTAPGTRTFSEGAEVRIFWSILRACKLDVPLGSEFLHSSSKRVTDMGLDKRLPCGGFCYDSGSNDRFEPVWFRQM